MKTNSKITIAIIAGAAISGAAIQSLHSQSKPPVYLVGEVDVTNLEGYAKEYSPKVRASVKAAGGRVIALGGGSETKNLTTLEGTPAKRVFIQVWDSQEQLQAWWNSADYKAARSVGNKYATFRHFVVDGVQQ